MIARVLQGSDYYSISLMWKLRHREVRAELQKVRKDFAHKKIKKEKRLHL